MIINIVALWTSVDTAKKAWEGPLPVIALVFIALGIFLLASTITFLILMKINKKKEEEELRKEVEKEIANSKNESD